jgi:hypothetical protein
MRDKAIHSVSFISHPNTIAISSVLSVASVANSNCKAIWIENIVRIQLLLDAFHQDCGLSSAAPNHVRREAVQRGFQHDQAAALLESGRPQLGEKHSAHVGMRESAEMRYDYTVSSVGLDLALWIERD